MKRLKLFIILLLILSLVLSIGGCNTSKTNSSPNSDVSKDSKTSDINNSSTGGVLKRPMVSDPRSFNPIFADDTASQEIIKLMFLSLLDVDSKNNLIPLLAESLPTISSDNKTITFNINKDVKWHDGVEVTSEDIKYSYELIMDKAVNSPRRGYFEAVSSISAPDKYTVVFNLSKVDSQILNYFTGPYILPKHIIEKLDRTELKQSAFSREPVGNGPFKFVEWKTNERVVLDANQNYFKGRPGLDQIIYTITPSSATSMVKLEGQEVNFAAVPEADVARMKTKPFLNVTSYVSSGFDAIQYNIKSVFFSDKKVRQAISYAVNRDAIIKGIYRGNAIPADTSYPPQLWFANPDVKKYDYNLTEAKKLLDEAGWKVGSDGIRVKNGQKLEFALLANKGNVAREKMIVFIQGALVQVGIKVNPRIIEWNTLFDKYIDPGKFDAYVAGYGAGSDMVQNYYTLDDYFNAGKYDNPKIVELQDKIKGTFDKEEQKKYVYEIQSILAEDCPFTYLTFGKTTYAYSKDLKNVKFVDLLGAFDIEKWYIQK